MARGVQIGLTLNPREFLRSLKRVELATEDVADEFRDIERKGDAAFDDVERSAEDAADDIERAFTNVRRDVEDEFDRMERAARSADIAPDIEGDVRKAASGAKGAVGALLGEVADELTESWGEAVRSGDYGDAIRETFSNLAQVGGAVFGPIGAVGGAAASFLLTGIYDRLTDTESKERVAALAGQLFDGAADREEAYNSGFEAATALREGFIAASQQDETLVSALGVDTVQEAWVEVGNLAAASGLPISTVVAAINGQEAAIAAVTTAIEGNQTAYSNILDEQGEVFTSDRARWQELENQKDALDNQINPLREILGYGQDTATANEEAATALENSTRASFETSENLRDAAAASRGTADNTAAVKRNVENTPDLDIKANVDRSQIDNLPTQKNLTIVANVRAATAKAQRLLDSGAI